MVWHTWLRPLLSGWGFSSRRSIKRKRNILMKTLGEGDGWILVIVLMMILSLLMSLGNYLLVRMLLPFILTFRIHVHVFTMETTRL